MSTKSICPQCGAAQPAQSPEGLCPKCLLLAGLASEPAATTPSPVQGAYAPRSPGHGGFVPPELDEIARAFPQLEILELLGRGGMGAVYKARQRELDRLVALKILPPEVGSDPAFAQRFSREARALARLNHPHVVTIYDSGQAGGLFYFLMEYVDGVNLRQTIRAGQLSAAEALAIVPQICDALQYAHDEGIVHRDIKPENILVDKRGRVKIADFGIAKLLASGGRESPDSALQLTGTEQVMGTLRYMAPEQMESAAHVDHRADIYSLGVVFYELLTGEVPMGRFEPPSQRVKIDVRLDEIVLRTLEREPARRYQRASEVKSDVQTVTSSPAIAAPARTAPTAGRRANMAVLIAGVLLLLSLPVIALLGAAIGYFVGEGVAVLLIFIVPLLLLFGLPLAIVLVAMGIRRGKIGATADNFPLRLTGPALGLLIAGILQFLLAPVLAPVLGWSCMVASDNYRTEAEFWLNLPAFSVIGVWLIVCLAASLTMIAGAMRVFSGQSTGWATAGAIASLIPLSPVWLISAPLGIWALIASARGRDKRSADNDRDSTNRPFAEMHKPMPSVSAVAPGLNAASATVAPRATELSDADLEAARHEVKVPAMALVVIGVLYLLICVIPLCVLPAVWFLLPFDHMPTDESKPHASAWQSDVARGALAAIDTATSAIARDAPQRDLLHAAIVAQSMPDAQRENPTWIFFLFGTLALGLLIQLPFSLLMIVGGWRMQRLESHGLAVLSSLVALLPCQLLWPLGLIVGIWSLIVLNRPHIKAAFQVAARKGNSGNADTLEVKTRAAAHRSARSVVEGPSAGLILIGGLTLVAHSGFFLWGISNDVGSWDWPIWFSLLGIPSGLVTLLGGISLRGLGSHGLATLGSCAAMLPVSPLVVIGLPLGVWALAALKKEHVRRAFDEALEQREAATARIAAGRVIETRDDLERLVVESLQQNKIEAIRVYRKATGAHLAEAKAAVETIAKLHGIRDVPATRQQRLLQVALPAAALAVAAGVISAADVSPVVQGGVIVGGAALLILWYFGLWMAIRSERIGSHDAASPERSPTSPRLSRLALWGAIWSPMTLLAAPAWQLIGRKLVDGGLFSGRLPQGADAVHPVFAVLGVLVFLVGASAGLGATLLGAVAIAQIKRSAGRLYGLPLAFVVMIAHPLVGTFVGIAWLVAQTISTVANVSIEQAAAPAALITLVPCFFIGRAAWRMVVGPATRK